MEVLQLLAKETVRFAIGLFGFSLLSGLVHDLIIGIGRTLDWIGNMFSKKKS